MKQLLNGAVMVAIGIILMLAMPGRDHTGSLFSIMFGVMTIHDAVTK